MRINAYDVQLGDILKDDSQKGIVVDFWRELEDGDTPYITIRVQESDLGLIDEIYGKSDTVEIVARLPDITF